MKLEFAKYEGAGNDFVIVDNRTINVKLLKEQIERLCNRRTGIGADGLLLLENSGGEEDYRMRYYNSDGSEAEMCGNGGRCIAKFAYDKQIAGVEQLFNASDGIHRATILGDNIVSLMMTTASDIEQVEGGYLINTGVVHYVEIAEYDQGRARELRRKYNANIDFVHVEAQELRIRTFEKGVEGETLACGTGAVAAALVWKHIHSELSMTERPITLKALGGVLEVSKDRENNIWLTGGANRVFEGVIQL